MVDQDQIVKAVAEALLLAHAVVAVWAVRRKTIAPVLALNFLISADVVADWAVRLPDLFGYVLAVWAFVGFELAVLVTSLLALRFRVSRALIWIEFVVHAFFVVAVLTFMFTFELPRMM
jgi:hypothetical protein